MAVDTATKRSSALSVRGGRRFNPVPDGSIAAADRSHVVSRYYIDPAPVTRVGTGAVTQPFTFSTYVGRRYGTYLRTRRPDFMHGVLNVYTYLDGPVRVYPSVSGEIQIEPYLRGKVEVNP